jgi:catechol 2,3-dioxygenase-like lactoylglutathione lyase family enzyme
VDQDGAIMTGMGISEVIFSTFDIERALKPLVETAGYRKIALPDAPRDQYAAWQVPEACSRIEQALFCAPGDTRGRIRAVCFHGLRKDLIRPSQRTWDTGGIFDLDMFSSDVRAVYRALQQDHGWTAFGEPVDYEMGEFDVAQVVARGADGLTLAIIQPHKKPTFDLPSLDAMSRVFNSTQLVADLDRALQFYEGVLGWKVLVREDVRGCVEPGADVLGIPMPMAETCLRKVAIVHPEGVNDGSVELIEIEGLEGRDFSGRAIAPNVGLLALRLTVPSPSGYAQEIVARGGVLYSDLRIVEIAPFGRLECFSVRSPEGAILEFIEPMNEALL